MRQADISFKGAGDPDIFFRGGGGGGGRGSPKSSLRGQGSPTSPLGGQGVPEIFFKEAGGPRHLL